MRAERAVGNSPACLPPAGAGRAGGIRHGVSGFTLAELMIAVAIVAILAGMALPQYRKTTELSYKQAAQDLIQTIYYGERAYFMANSKYTDPAGNWGKIYMENPNVASIPVAYTVTPNGAFTAFTATATRGPGGLCSGRVLTIDQTRTVAGTWLTCP